MSIEVAKAIHKEIDVVVNNILNILDNIKIDHSLIEDIVSRQEISEKLSKLNTQWDDLKKEYIEELLT